MFKIPICLPSSLAWRRIRYPEKTWSEEPITKMDEQAETWKRRTWLVGKSYISMYRLGQYLCLNKIITKFDFDLETKMHAVS